MEALLKLLGLVEESKKAEAQQLHDAVKTVIDGLDAKVNEQERLKLDAIATRDAIKSQLKNISTGLGVEAENVIDAIEAIKSSKGGNNEIKDKEIEQLKREISELTGRLENTTKESTQKILAMALKNDIATVLPAYKPKASGVQYIIDAIEKQAHIEDGKVVFKNADGTTLRIGGKDATVEDMVKQMQEKEKATNESMFFNIEVQASGASGAGGGKVTKDLVL
jgi:hypothetical protein